MAAENNGVTFVKLIWPSRGVTEAINNDKYFVTFAPHTHTLYTSCGGEKSEVAKRDGALLFLF